MTELADLQKSFADAVTGDAGPVLSLLNNDGRQADRFEVHRNNTFASLKSVLEDAFPAVAEILGEELFQRLSAAFVRHHPPRRNHLLDFGDALPDFIRLSEPLARWPFLGDLAEIEWAVNWSYGAAGADTLTPDHLAALPPEQLAGTALPLKPSARLVRSEWPVHALRMNPAVGAEPERVAQRGESVLVIRPDMDVIAIPVSSAECDFLGALLDGKSLGEAAGEGLAADPAFDIQGALARHIAGGHFARTPNGQEQGDPS